MGISFISWSTISIILITTNFYTEKSFLWTYGILDLIYSKGSSCGSICSP